MEIGLYIVAVVMTSAMTSAVLEVKPREGNFTAVFTAEGLNHTVVDYGGTGRIYIGAMNKLYRLDPNLEEELWAETGPIEDNPLCTYNYFNQDTCPSGTQTVDKSETNNINKVLVIDPDNRHLITCGSVQQGTCQTRPLSNIKNATGYTTRAEYYIAANDPTSSTVAFVGPGINDGKSALYVASSFSLAEGVGEIRAEVPAVSSRNLDGNRVLRYSNTDDLSGQGTFVKLDSQARDQYQINYVAGFSHDGFSYFLSTQKEFYDPQNPSDKYVSKIIQVCQRDEKYHSYVEMELKCRASDGTEYNLVQSAAMVKPGSTLANNMEVANIDQVLIATFAKSMENTNEPTDNSAICMFRFSDIRAKFTENVKECFNGAQANLGRHFGGTCIKADALVSQINEQYCGDYEINSPLAGDIPVESVIAIPFPVDMLTAITVDVTGAHTVAFVGTSNGHLKKVLLDQEDAAHGRVYDDITVSKDDPIKQDMHLSADGKHVLVLTSSKLYKIPVSECGRFTDCANCRDARDPYCGWCSLENKCAPASECQTAEGEKRWLSYKAWECIGIEWYQPKESSVKIQKSVTLNVKQLPPLEEGHRYMCWFGSDRAITVASVSGNDVTCQTPALSVLPDIPGNSDHTVITLAIRATETNKSFLHTVFTFYNCSRHTACSKCTDTQWGCNWCIHDGKCTHQGPGCNPLSTPVFTNARCPRLEDVQPGSEILLPVGYSRSIEIPASNLPTPLEALNQTGYECLVHLGTPPIRVPATRVSASSVRCDSYSYTYTKAQDKEKVSLEVVWNGNFLIDDADARTVEVYKCNLMGLDCSMCMSLVEKIDSSKYRCKWCNVNGGQCRYQETCKENETVSKCPEPSIDSVSPITSAIQGGTEVTIKGSNLGQRFDQVKDSVTIAGEPCTAIRDSYIIAREIVCKTQPVSGEKQGHVQVTIDSETVAFETKFRYQNPQLEGIFPNEGPQAGGTRVTITGTSLATGQDISVKFGAAACVVISVNNTQIVCETSSVMNADPYEVVTVTFEGAVRSLPEETFNYEEDPDITSVTPLISYFSGGRKIVVKGHHLDSVQQPQMFLAQGSRTSETTLCTTINGGKLECPSPKAHLTATRARRQSAVGVFTVGLLMDGVLTTRNISTMTVHPDPEYHKFELGQKEYTGGKLELTGEDLNAACTAAEVTVLIGEDKCEVSTLDKQSLFCEAPEIQPFGLNGQGLRDGNVLPEVTVKVGTNLNFSLGLLMYQEPIEAPPPSEWWIIGVAVGGGIVITVFIIIVIIYKRRSSEAERQYKKMQIQLDTLESNVRNECKQAFAELQTEVGDFTSDLNVIGIPFWDYKSYTFKVLFPSHNDHPILHNAYDIHTNKFGGYEQGLQQFNQLLNSKHFLVIFIRTLEAQKNFSIRDKSIVASLLMIVLQDKMEYATEILKSLLNELVDKSVEKKHPKLMLRRTESVVEKLLANWLSLCMYVYLKKHAGKTFFMLFKAIKHQTEKGPIDAITSEARYSLSEDRLLREKIEAKTLNVYLVSEATRDPVACKLLDCDTITQAKEKVLDAIYMNTPFSRRPSVYDVDLEWRSGRSGHLPLQDEDVTTETVHGWKKVNCIAHYHVPDGATMALVPSRNKSDLVRHVHGMVEISTGSSLSAITPIITMEEGTKVWHLLKHDDSHNAQRSQKVISEIFLTRLLATKGTLQQYIDDLFMTILRVDSTLPPAVKYLFDFLDNAARRHNIVDPEVVHTWKCNSLPLRFWVNIIKNPEFVFDIHKSHIVDSCLSVIAQTFMDSCSVQEHRLGKDSPSNKLLFAKDIPKYRQWVGRFYKNVSEMAPVSDPEMTRVMTELSMTNLTDFNVSVALKELYKYATQYNFELLEALDDDPSAKKMHLANKFEQVAASIEGSPLY